MRIHGAHRLAADLLLHGMVDRPVQSLSILADHGTRLG
jgi:hypothetical protein